MSSTRPMPLTATPVFTVSELLAHHFAQAGLTETARHIALWVYVHCLGVTSRKARRHLEQTIALYHRTEHGQLATRFSEDPAVHALAYRSLANWYLGYPGAALADADHALSDAREIGQAATLMITLAVTSLTYAFCGHYATAQALIEDLVSLANEKGAAWWRARGLLARGWLLAMTGEAADAVQIITSGLSENRSMGATVNVPFYLSQFGGAYGQLGQFGDAWRCIGEAITAMETTGERCCEAEVHRIAGEMALKSPEPDMAKAEAYLQRALAISCAQQAKSWELRAATSMARLWRDQGKRQQARELLAPVYGWFTEGFDTLDLKQARALLDELT